MTPSVTSRGPTFRTCEISSTRYTLQQHYGDGGVRYAPEDLQLEGRMARVRQPAGTTSTAQYSTKSVRRGIDDVTDGSDVLESESRSTAPKRWRRLTSSIDQILRTGRHFSEYRRSRTDPVRDDHG
jgi:hypothetical protein